MFLTIEKYYYYMFNNRMVKRKEKTVQIYSISPLFIWNCLIPNFMGGGGILIGQKFQPLKLAHFLGYYALCACVCTYQKFISPLICLINLMTVLHIKTHRALKLEKSAINKCGHDWLQNYLKG